MKKLNSSSNVEFKQKSSKSKDYENLNQQLKAQIQKHQEENEDLQQKYRDTQKQSKEQTEKYQKDLDEKTREAKKSYSEVASLKERIGK